MAVVRVHHQNANEKGGARVSAGTAGGRRYEVYLGMGVKAKKAGLEDFRRSLNHRYLRETITMFKLVLTYL